MRTAVVALVWATAIAALVTIGTAPLPWWLTAAWVVTAALWSAAWYATERRRVREQGDCPTRREWRHLSTVLSFHLDEHAEGTKAWEWNMALWRKLQPLCEWQKEEDE